MNDIQNREDIELIVNAFYKKAIQDDEIGFFFTDIAKIKLDEHLPKMYNFWESIILGNPVYNGNPMRVHFPINKVAALEKRHFDRWLMLWETTLIRHFRGENTDVAITRAQNIARIMSHKMQYARSRDSD